MSSAYVGFPEKYAPTILSAVPINPKITTIAHAEPELILFVIRKPIAASIHPQIKKISRVAKSVANTGC